MIYTAFNKYTTITIMVNWLLIYNDSFDNDNNTDINNNNSNTNDY